MTSRSTDNDREVPALLVLRQRARATNLARLRSVADTLRRIENGTASEGERRRALDITHQIVGSAGTFGYPRASELAARLEDFFRRVEVDALCRRQAGEWLSAIKAELETDHSGTGARDEL